MLWVEAALICVFVLSELRCGIVVTCGKSELCGCWYLQDDGTTPLVVACCQGYDAVVRTLLASGAAVNQATTVGVRCSALVWEVVLQCAHLRCCAILGTWLLLMSRVCWFVVG